MTAPLRLVPGALDLETLAALAAGGRDVVLDAAAWPAVDAAATTVARAARGEHPVYGVNTGFGKLARTRVAPGATAELQHRLVRSHMCGTGRPLCDSVVRLVLGLKIATLGRGHSGVRRETIEALLALLVADALPEIPEQGSVGASGDLAPLAHMAAVLIGEGEVRLRGESLPAADALARIGRAPLTLAAKEGLALLNGTQVSTALAIHALFGVWRLVDAALLAGAMSVDAARGSDVPFDARIQTLRGQPGQIRVAARLRALLAGSGIRASHLDCDRVQDPYSLRCQPQVTGACVDLIDQAAATLLREANGVSDNPLVFAETGDILSGGNFHAQPVAFAADQLALAISEIGSIAERRIALLTDATQSGLPAFLSPEPGLNSGFMIAQVTAAAAVAENRHLAHPVGIDSLPTSANQEDRVSMATYAARRLAPTLDNAFRIVAIELLAAAQGLELLRPLRSSDALERARAALRTLSPALGEDRALAPDIAAVAARLATGWPEAGLHGTAECLHPFQHGR